MVTTKHEVAHRIFRDRPRLVEPVFRILDLPLPKAAAIDIVDPSCTELRIIERDVDTVLKITPHDGSPGFYLLVEAQMRKDPDKAASWAHYATYFHSQERLPVLLLVVCHDETTAKWAAGPFRMGTPEWTTVSVHPLVIGPHNMPRITNVTEALANLELATFAAIAHAGDKDIRVILEALAAALGSSCEDEKAFHHQMVDLGLNGTSAQEYWRHLMTVENFFRGSGTLVDVTMQKGIAQGREEGREEGREALASAVLSLLENRGVAVPTEVRERIGSCKDMDLLKTLLARAVSATSAEELFDAPGV